MVATRELKSIFSSVVIILLIISCSSQNVEDSKFIGSYRYTEPDTAINVITHITEMSLNLNCIIIRELDFKDDGMCYYDAGGKDLKEID